MAVLDSPQRLARLLTSLNVPGTDRPLSPVEAAGEIAAMRDELGGDEKEVARRLPVSKHIVGEFLRLERLPAEIRDAVVWGESRGADGSIGFSAAAKMARLGSGADMLKLAAALLDTPRPITKEEVKGVVSLKRRMPDRPIEECIAEVLNVTRSLAVRHFLFISGVKASTARALDAGRVTREGLAAALRGSFPAGSLKDARAFGGCVRLSLDEEGWKSIGAYAERHGLLRQEVVGHMLEAAGLAGDGQ